MHNHSRVRLAQNFGDRKLWRVLSAKNFYPSHYVVYIRQPIPHCFVSQNGHWQLSTKGFYCQSLYHTIDLTIKCMTHEKYFVCEK